MFKDQLEEKANIHREPRDTIAQWLIRWAAMNVSRYHEGGDDHKTPFQRHMVDRADLPLSNLGNRSTTNASRTRQHNLENLIPNGKRASGWGTPDPPTKSWSEHELA